MADGKCAIVTSVRICPPANSSCGSAEVCDGASASCPADASKLEGTLCCAAAGPCDMAETCDGLTGI